MIRVLCILSGLGGGGVENMLLNYYRNFDRNKIKMDIIVHSPHKGSLEDTFSSLGCEVCHVTPKGENLLKNIRDISLIMKKGKYDIVHSHMDFRGLTHLISAWVCGIKVRMSHSHIAYMPIKGGLKFIAPIAKKMCMLFATDLLACSEDAAIDMYGYQAVINKKVIILNNAIDAKKYEFNEIIRDEVRNEFGLHNEFVIGMVGRFCEQKNHKFMIEIFDNILEKAPNTRLLLVGDGGLYDEIFALVKQNKMDNRVIFTGVRNDVSRLMQAMDVFCLPTLFEGLGIVLLESQAAGLKTITSEEGVPKETRITDLIEYISLSEASSVWADRILQCNNGYSRKSHYREIQEAGFDVMDQAHRFEQFYVNAYERSKR